MKYFIITFLLLFTTAIAFAAGNDNKIEWEGIYSDQTSLYFSPLEPDIDSEIQVTLRSYKDDLTSCDLRYWDGEEHFTDMELKSDNTSRIYDYWSGKIPAGREKKSYRFFLKDGNDSGWYSSIGKMEEPVYDRDFLIIPGFKTPDWIKNAVVYQIFPDRFFDGDRENNVKTAEYRYMDTEVYTHENWSDLPEQPTKCADFFGGDLNGVKEKLPYLGDLGISAIYLNPVFLSPSNHKYDTQDYREVDPHFGGNAALKELVEEAHKKNIKIILDGVFNHTGSKHYWFDREHIYDTDGAYESRESPWHDFYTFLEWPDNYYSWWGFSTLPKLNYGSPGVREEIYGGENSIARMWIKEYKIDGWRLDVPNEVGVGIRTDEHGIWKEFRKAVKNENPDAYIAGEIWGNASPWLDGGEFDSVMNYYGHMEPVWMWLAGVDHNGYSAKMNVTGLDEWLTCTRANYYYPCIQAGLNLLDSHDTARFLSIAGGDRGKLKVASLFQMTYVGAPMIYYGDEIGMEGGKDPDCRRTFNWNEAEWDNELREYYKKIISIRNNYEALRTGSFETLIINDEKNIYAFTRYDRNNKLIVILNGGEEDQTLNVPVWKLDISENSFLEDLLYGGKYEISEGQAEVSVKSKDGLVVIVRSEP